MENATIDRIAWINIKDGKILMVRAKGKNNFYTPGGKRKDGETDIQTLTRELKEELSIDVIPETVELFDVYKAEADKINENIMVKITCYTCNYKDDLKNATEIEEISWLDSSNLDILSAAGKIIFADLKSKGLIN